MKVFLAIVVCIFVADKSWAQTIPAFRQLRYEEDYSFLRTDSNRSWYEATKFEPLSNDKRTYLSFGGDLRLQYLLFRNENWGDAPKDEDGYILTRYLAHADLHVRNNFRAFIQMQSSLANGKVATPSPVDENQLDLHQAFADIIIPLRVSQKLTMRIGRQELLYGSQRLVAVRDGPNNRQSFDAGRLIYNRDGLTADLFFSHFVRSRQKIFDDGFNKLVKFWGAYLVKNKLPFLKNVDLYYFGLWKKNASYDDGAGEEMRHSIGSRIWGNAHNWRYDAEGLYQFGDFAGKKISAWTFSINTGYKFNHIKLKPELGIKTELISGDARSGDNKLQTFNPLFPRGGYFGLVSLIGPSNLFDIHPSLAMDLSRKLFLNMDYDIFWRYSKNDGIYGPNAVMIYSGKASGHKYVGRQYSMDLVYTPNNFLYFRGEFTWFKAGSYLRDVSAGKNILFTAFTTQLRF